MGFQVTPCANIPASPCKLSRAAAAACHSEDSSVASATNHPPNNHPSSHSLYESKIQAPNTEETKQLPAADINHGVAAPCCSTSTSSILSPRSAHSAKFLLSQCSSLASLPSLGLSLNGGSSDILYGESKAQLLGGAADSRICAHCSCTATLKSLGDQVACDASADDGFFYSASSGCATLFLKTWSMHGGDVYQINAGFGSKREGAVRATLVVGDQVFSSHSDLKIRVWTRPGNVKGEKLSACTGGGGGGHGGGEHRLVATLPTRWDCMARAVTPGGYRQVRRHHRKLWIEHADAISAMAVDAKQGYLYSGSWDRTVKVWRLRDFKCVESFRAHDDAINTLALSVDGRFLYTAAADGKIKVWTWGDGASRHCRQAHFLVATLQAHRSAVNALALSEDGALLYSGACDKAIVVWEREESASQHACLAGALRGHCQAVLCLASWGNTLCSGSADKSIRVWQRLAGRLHVCLAVLQGHSAPIKSLSLLSLSQQHRPPSPASAGFALCSAALDHDIKVWQINLSFNS